MERQDVSYYFSHLHGKIPLHRHDYLYSTVRSPKGSTSNETLFGVVVNLDQDPLSSRKEVIHIGDRRFHVYE